MGEDVNKEGNTWKEFEKYCRRHGLTWGRGIELITEQNMPTIDSILREKGGKRWLQQTNL